MAVSGNVKQMKGSQQTESVNGIVKFFKELKAELKRITWAPRKDVKKASIAVFIFCLIFVLFITAADFCFSHLYSLVFK